MDWLGCIRYVIDYVENNILENISINNIAEKVNISPFFLQRGFSFMTGYGIGEYIRNRRLYLAAIEIKETNNKIIDIALKYCYESHESFTKAFTRYHGYTPSKVRDGAPINVFLPLKININITGGHQMNYKIAPMFSIKFIGFQKVFSYENAHAEIPKFWDELCEKYANNVYAGNEPRNGYEKAIIDYCIGEYAVCIDDIDNTKFRYLVAGKYTGGEVPEGMVVYEFPRGMWAIFDCVGPIPETLQSVSTRIFSEWLPNNKEYELNGNANIEWYDCVMDMNDPNYHSQVWIPIKNKNN